MSQQGPNSPSSVVDATNPFGSVAWPNPGNVTSSDNVYSSISFSDGSRSHDLFATGFGFTIPGNAIIKGIRLEIERKDDIQLIVDDRVRLVRAGVVETTDKSIGSSWPSTEQYASYGSATDLWGTSWIPSDINASDFGAILSILGFPGVVAFVDHMRITVYYETNFSVKFQHA